MRGKMRSPALLSLLVAACGGGGETTTSPPPPPPPVLTLTLKAPPSVAVGGTLPIAAVVTPAGPVSWVSETPGVATVSAAGAVTGVAPGTATIRATAGQASATASVAVFPGLVELTLGGRHACARTASLEVWCWGRNNDAELGLLTPVEICQTPGGTFPCSTTPRRNPGAPAFTQISAGEFRTCGLTASGEVYCTAANSAAPVKVSGSVGFSWIGASDSGECGLTSTGAAYCHGGNDYGQLGAPSTDQCGGSPCSLVPIPVSGGLTFQSLTVHGYHTCGLTPSGTAYCWGWNAWGQLGNGSLGPPAGVGSPVPVQVAGGHQFVAISAGKQNTCALEASGQAWCWGANEGGQIGDGSPPAGPDVAFSVPRAVSGNLSFASIAEGLQHTCALTPAGEAYCWGANQDGQLGDGTTTLRLTPTRVSLTVPLAEIAGGRNGTCGRTATGRVYCWGTNLYGRLGIGAQIPDHSALPVGVGGAP